MFMIYKRFILSNDKTHKRYNLETSSSQNSNSHTYTIEIHHETIFPQSILIYGFQILLPRLVIDIAQ